MKKLYPYWRFPLFTKGGATPPKGDYTAQDGITPKGHCTIQGGTTSPKELHQSRPKGLHHPRGDYTTQGTTPPKVGLHDPRDYTTPG